ncbi:RDD family protein [Pengzhenrongella sicca]|uniref:RDD family protein n=1 Tax=Pengzhenrongella sicca TaxID=2819238 RepID=A0A8A4ZBM6_9MICO|nr:RDD family protein [Pengzhenrongella sicca]QTE28409.1 RDD family protein [Pengzhenrongella sicca]
MATRDDLGSWATGPGSPAQGPSRQAPLGRRVVALTVDWLLCLAISGAFFGGDPLATLGVFALEHVALVGTLGHTLGHRLLGIHVRPVGAPGPVGLGRAALRTALLCLVLPAVLTGPDGRGLHDRAAGTVVVRL